MTIIQYQAAKLRKFIWQYRAGGEIMANIIDFLTG
jgi:hypothetical protein